MPLRFTYAFSKMFYVYVLSILQGTEDTEANCDTRSLPPGWLIPPALGGSSLSAHVGLRLQHCLCKFSGPLVVEKLITYSEAPWKEFSRGSLVLQELGAWGWAPFALSGLALPPDAWALPPRQQELGLPGKTECVNSGPQEGLLCLCVGFSQSED